MHTRWWRTWRDSTAMGTPATMPSISSLMTDEDGRNCGPQVEHVHAYVALSRTVGADQLRTSRFHRFTAVLHATECSSREPYHATLLLCSMPLYSSMLHSPAHHHDINQHWRLSYDTPTPSTILSQVTRRQ
jgi:hypothetical protein